MIAPPLSRPSPLSARNGAEAARVMLCDDSVVVRGALARMLESDPAIRVVARVANGQLAVDEVARQTALRQWVDVLVLDIEMPVMDGLTALPLLLQADPGLKIIVASTLTTRGADIALLALRLGAADYLLKPMANGPAADDGFRRELIAKVRGLARLRGLADRAGVPAAPRQSQPILRPAPSLPPLLLAVGASTGGPQALFTLFQALGAGLRVPVMLTQHMPAGFTPILADHIGKLGFMPCAEAMDNEPLLPGRIYLAPGDRHLLARNRGGILQAQITNDPPENFCRPSVDPMLSSAAQACGGRVLVAMLTGMGQDGLAGTSAVIGQGGTAIAQDEASSVVWGMPGAIARAGLCHAILPLAAMAPKLLQMLRPAAA